MKYFVFLLLIFTFTNSFAQSSCQSAFFNKGPAYDLFEAAMQARNNAYAPNSNYFVGAALRATSGEIYCGCNVENKAYGTTQCAEATATGNMISAGDKEIKEAVVLGNCSGGLCTPCGNCRQILKEFANDDIKVHIYDPKEGYKATYTLGVLLPQSFNF